MVGSVSRGWPVSWSPADGPPPAVTLVQLIAAVAALALVVTGVAVAGWIGWIVLR